MKKKLVLLLVTALSGAVLAGCGSSDKASSNASSASSVAASASSEANDAAGDASSAESDAASTEASLTVFGDDAYLSHYKVSDYVTLGDYKGLTVEAAAVNVTDDDVKNEIASNYLSSITESVTDRAVKDGDIVNIDYKGTYADTGEAFDGGTAQGQDLTIGSGQFIDGFEDGLIGAKIGDTVKLDLTFPDDYQSTDLAGKAVVFEVTVNSISTAATEVTDDNVSSLGIDGVDTAKALTEYVRKDLESSAQDEYDSTVQDGVIEQVVANAKFADEFPEALVNRYVQMYNNSLDYYASMYSQYTGTTMTGDDYLTSYLTSKGEDTSDLEAYKKNAATDQIKATLAAYAVAEAEGIKVTDDEINEELSNAASSGGYSDNESYEDYYMEQVGMSVKELVTESLTDEKAMDFLSENAVVVEPKADSSASASTASSK